MTLAHSPSFPFPLVAYSFALLLLSPAVKSQDLEAVTCGAQFPSGINSMSSIYSGDGKIFLFGGSTGGGVYSDSIHLYDVWDDTLTWVGDLPTPTYGSALAEDSLGNLLHLGGIDLDTILRFNTSSGDTHVVGLLPKEMETIGAVPIKTDSALVFGYNDILEVDLSTFQVTQVGAIQRSTGVAWDGGDRVLLFRPFSSEHQLYSISDSSATNFTSPESHLFDLWHSVISTPKSAWIVGNRGTNVDRGNGIFEVDFDTLEFTFWQVDNYPVPSDRDFLHATTTYVPELHRLYIFGGTNGTRRQEIMYIDLPGGNEVTTTTTPPFPTFDCSNRPDGFYVNPYACERYFGCRRGEAFEFECPPPYHFNPELGVCDLPEVVRCDLSCSEKEDGLYPHWHYCSFYLRCLEGEGHVLECPSPLLFDSVELRCNFPDLVNCTKSVNQ